MNRCNRLVFFCVAVFSGDSDSGLASIDKLLLSPREPPISFDRLTRLDLFAVVGLELAKPLPLVAYEVIEPVRTAIPGAPPSFEYGLEAGLA